MSIVGVPKTIDNGILLMDKTFGFDTAVEAAQRVINSAYIEVIQLSNLSASHAYMFSSKQCNITSHWLSVVTQKFGCG